MNKIFKKWWFWVAVAVVIVAALMFLMCNQESVVAINGEVMSEDSASADEIVNKVRQSDRIYVTEFAVQKIVTADDVKKLNVGSMKFELPIGDRKVAIPMDAILKAYIDFESLTPADVKVIENPRRLEISLSAPKVEMTSSKINQAEVKEYTAILRSSFSDKELTKFEKQGRQAILDAVPNMGITKQAEQNARDILVPMFMQFGYEANEISIKFKN